jgi:ligand-binding sensor domain-containing protein/signal transduction histidine kinase
MVSRGFHGGRHRGTLEFARMLGRFPLFAFIALALPAAAAAQTRHLIDRWGVEEGLPNNALASILQTRDGYLWIATWAGTVRFDGVRFTPIAENLPNDHARALFEDRDGSVWIGVAGSGLSRWRPAAIEVFTTAQGLAGNDVRTILQDTGGRIWAGTENGLSIVTPAGIETRRAGDGLPANEVTGLALARGGGVWVATTKGVCLAIAASRGCSAAGPPITGRVDAVLEDREGRLWLGTPQGLIVHADHPACAGRCLAGAPVTTLRQTRDGDVWAGLGTGAVARLHTGGIDSFGAAEGLPPGNVVAMHEDAEGSLWVATYYGGLARIKRKRVNTYSTADGLPADAIGSIVQDGHGDIWAGSQCGPVSILREGRFVPRFADEMRGVCAWVLWPARDGTLWIGTRGSGLYRWTGRRLEHFGPAEGLSDNHVAALFEDRDGVIWIGTELGGLHLYRDGRLSRAYGPADGVATPYLASFAQDRDGRVWIGSNANGLSVYERGTFRTLPPEESPPTRNIAGLLVDSRGDLWVGSAANGLFRRRNGRYEPFGIDQGLGDRLVAVVIEDRDANLWVGTTRGISRLSRDRIEAVAEGRAASLDPIVLDRSDGMRHTEGSGGGLDPSGLRDRDGRLWFSTIDGIAVIDPATFARNQIVPSVLVESALLDERPHAPRADGAFEIPAGTSAIEIGYTAFSFMAPAKMRFRYRLAGFDRSWHEVGARRAAYYSRLPPGDYTLEVMATNNDGVWSTAPGTARLVVLPFFWERPAVQLAALALLLVGTALAANGLAQRRARRRLADLERERALDRERIRIARDLHDDLGSRLAHIALISDRGASGDRVSTAVRTAVESLDELVWTVNARHDTVEGFAAYAARYAEEHVSAAGLRLRLVIPPDLPPLEIRSETRRHMYLAYKEAVNNAVKHAQASEIQVGIALENSVLRLEVSDNGKGLQGTGDPTGNGLTNMRERLAGVGGTVRFDARSGGGLSVVFKAPIDAASAVRLG